MEDNVVKFKETSDIDGFSSMTSQRMQIVFNESFFPPFRCLDMLRHRGDFSSHARFLSCNMETRPGKAVTFHTKWLGAKLTFQHEKPSIHLASPEGWADWWKNTSNPSNASGLGGKIHATKHQLSYFYAICIFCHKNYAYFKKSCLISICI